MTCETVTQSNLNVEGHPRFVEDAGDSELSIVADALYKHMPPVCWKTVSTLADELGVTRFQICKAKEELEDAGKIVINYYKNGGRKNPRHEILKVKSHKSDLSKSIYEPCLGWMWSELDRMGLIEQYLNSKLEILPFEPRGKKPVMGLALWRRKCQTAKSVIDYFYREQSVNVGLVVRGMTVIDLDAKDIPEEFERREFDDTLTSETGKGFQFFFQADPVVKTSAKVYSDCVDTKCRDSFVVLPPSVHENGSRYRWVTCGVLEKLPVSVRRDWQKRFFALGEYRPFYLPATIVEGFRNDTLFRHGRSLRRRGHTFAEIESELNQANELRCRPALDPLEMRRLVRNVWYLRDRYDYAAAA